MLVQSGCCSHHHDAARGGAAVTARGNAATQRLASALEGCAIHEVQLERSRGYASLSDAKGEEAGLSKIPEVRNDEATEQD